MKDSQNTISEQFQIKKLNKFRTRRVFSLFGFIIVDGFNSDYVWTNRWFKYVTIKEQRVKMRYLEFDDGWSYKFYWTKWKYVWRFISIKN